MACWAAQQRREDPLPQAAMIRRTAAWPAPSNRRRAKLSTTAPDSLDAQEIMLLAYPADATPDLARDGELATGFSVLVKDKAGVDRPTQFKAWLASPRERSWTPLWVASTVMTMRCCQPWSSPEALDLSRDRSTD